MKRSPQLRDLSEDHHHALVLARSAKLAADGEQKFQIASVWAEVELKMQRELEPHFEIEETLLAPALEQQGERILVNRLRADHAALRSHFRKHSARGAVELRLFGELLEEHVRFEERELFEVAERTLSAATLEAVAMACRKSRERR